MPNYAIVREEGKSGGSIYHDGITGYYYHFHKHLEAAGFAPTVYFRCVKTACRGRALLQFGHQLVHTQQHNHPHDFLYPSVLAHRQAIVNEARSLTYVSFNEIIRAEKLRIPDPHVRSQITLRGLRSAMQRSRLDIFPHVPEDLVGLSAILQDPQWQYISQTNDLLDSIYLGSATGLDGSHNIVFISARCLDFMRTVNILFADGTFYITPSIARCYQVFTLVTIHDHTVIPLCWCLMESKSQAAYEAVLGLIRVNLGNWRFTKVISDFEDAIMNSFHIVFQVEVQGCLFHAADAMAKHAKSTIGLLLICNLNEVELVIRLCCSLPLLPEDLLQRGLNVIGTFALLMGDIIYGIVRPFLMYVQQHWLGHVNRGAALSVCGSAHRTNNASETNNGRMNRRVKTHHPNVFHFGICATLSKSQLMTLHAWQEEGFQPGTEMSQLFPMMNTSGTSPMIYCQSQTQVMLPSWRS